MNEDHIYLKLKKEHSSIFKMTITFVLIFLIYTPIFGQKNYTFNDHCIVRSEPNIKSEILFSLPAKTFLFTGNKSYSYHKKDTINNQEGHWVNVDYLGHKGYVWGHLISDNSFMTNQGELVLLKKRGKSKIESKIFKEDLLVSNRIDIIHALELIGKTIIDGSSLFELTNTYIITDDLSTQYITLNNHVITKKDMAIHPSILKPMHFIEDTSFIGVVKGNIVNIRALPNDSSDVIGKLTNNQIVSIDSIGKTQIFNLETKRSWGKWVKIDLDGMSGYVWDEYLIVPNKIHIQKETNTRFLLSYRSLFALDAQNNILSEYVITDKTIGNNYMWIKDLNVKIQPCPFNTVYDYSAQITLSIHYGEMDVNSQDNDVYIWNGKKFSKIYSPYQSFDAGLSWTTSYNSIVLDEKKMNNGVIRIVKEEEEFHKSYYDVIDYYGIKQYERYNRIDILRLKEDTLILQPSRVLVLESELQKDHKGYTIANYEFQDYNLDGILDVVFYAERKKHYTDDSTNGILGYAQGLVNSTFEIIQLNSTIIKDGKARKIEPTAQGFLVVNVTYDMHSNSDVIKGFRMFNFKYNTENDRFYLDYKRINWSNRIYYKENPILLEHAY